MPDICQQLLSGSSVHTDWIPLLHNSLKSCDQQYLQSLVKDPHWLPGPEKLFNAFQSDPQQLRYIVFGESPYPRPESANGIAFHDAAVNELWSETGLSKRVNRATSLRNLIKTMLIAEGFFNHEDRQITQPMIASLDKKLLIKTSGELFRKLQAKGVLLINATPVLHSKRKPAQEARLWHPFTHALLQQIHKQTSELPQLILWGKIAQQIQQIEIAQQFPRQVCEHPYNISFIHNPQMQSWFRELKLLSI